MENVKLYKTKQFANSSLHYILGRKKNIYKNKFNRIAPIKTHKISLGLDASKENIATGNSETEKQEKLSVQLYCYPATPFCQRYNNIFK